MLFPGIPRLNLLFRALHRAGIYLLKCLAKRIEFPKAAPIAPSIAKPAINFDVGLGGGQLLVVFRKIIHSADN